MTNEEGIVTSLPMTNVKYLIQYISILIIDFTNSLQLHHTFNTFSGYTKNVGKLQLSVNT